MLPQHLDHALRRAVARVDDRDAVVVAQPPLHVGDGALQVAAVGLGRLGGQGPGGHGARLDVDVDADDLAELVSQHFGG